jgi:hypothetical protein
MTSSKQQEAAERIRADRGFWRGLVEEVGRERMNEPGPMGEWTFRDLVAHLAAWRNPRIAAIEAAGRGEAPPPEPWPADLEDDDVINDWFQQRDRDRPLEEVLGDYDSSFERLAAAIEALPEEVANDPNAFEWTGGEPLVDGDFGGHLHEEHVPAIRAWLDRSKARQPV